MGRLLFLLLFIPAHSFVTLLAVQWAFNPPPGVPGMLWKGVALTVASPVILPLMMFDPDGDRLPRWVQWLSLPVNSLVWGLAILLVVSLIERLLTRRRGPNGD
jgi:hypothetical protein